MTGLKLYVWEKVLVDYTDGVMFALASSAEEARAKVLERCRYVPADDLAKEPQVFDSPAGFAVWGGG